MLYDPLYNPPSCFFISGGICAHVAHTYHVHKEAVTPEGSGLVFDSMPSEWLISQCFDLLQLLEFLFGKSLDLIHFTENSVAAL